MVYNSLLLFTFTKRNNCSWLILLYYITGTYNLIVSYCIILLVFMPMSSERKKKRVKLTVSAWTRKFMLSNNLIFRPAELNIMLFLLFFLPLNNKEFCCWKWDLHYFQEHIPEHKGQIFCHYYHENMAKLVLPVVHSRHQYSWSKVCGVFLGGHSHCYSRDIVGAFLHHMQNLFHEMQNQMQVHFAVQKKNVSQNMLVFL